MVVIFPAGASAHRLDEYLQATRIAIQRDGIAVEINLTPGAEIADGIVDGIDLDGNDEISEAEAQTYANRVIQSLSLNIDGIARSLGLRDYRVPPLADMRQGEGVIRLHAFASHSGEAGPHQLRFANAHRPDIGVYMVNALIPDDDGIHVTGQSRDMLQKEFSLDYTVSPRPTTAAFALALPSLIGLAMASAVYLLCRRSGDSGPGRKSLP